MRISRVFTSILTAAALCGAATTGHAQAVQATPFITTIAGIPSGSTNTVCANDIPTIVNLNTGDGCLPTQASFNAPSSNTVDVYGNIYITDYTEHQLRVIYHGGPVLKAILKAASPNVTNWDPTPGAPVAVDPVPGRIYTLTGGLQAVLATTGTPKLLYCNSSGSGLVANASNGDNCPGTEAYIQARGISIDSYGNIFLSSLGGGEGMRVLYAGGTGNPVGQLISTEVPAITNPQVGFVYSITGSTSTGYTGDGLLARTAKLTNVRDAVADRYGNIFISDANLTASNANNAIRVIYGGGGPSANPIYNLITAHIAAHPLPTSPVPTTTPTYGYIYTVVGGPETAGATSSCPATLTATNGFGGDGGPAANAVINAPYAMFEDAAGNLYFADSCNGRLRVVYLTQGSTIPNVSSPVVGNIYTVAGGGTVLGPQTGVPATSLDITLMQSAGIDAAGNIYVGDNTNRLVWQINPVTGIATLFGGLGISAYPGGTTVAAPASGVFCNRGTAGPTSVDSIGDGCPALEASVSPSLRFSGDNLGNVYSMDNGVLRRYSFNNAFPATAVGSSATQTLAFTSSTAPLSVGFSLEGTSPTTDFSSGPTITCSSVASVPVSSVCVDSISFTPTQAGTRNGSIRFTNVSTNFATELLAGSGTGPQLSIDPSTPAPGALGSGLAPQGLAADLSGNLYVADATSNQVKKIVISSNSSSAFISTGLSNPHQIAVDGTGNVFVADTGNNRIAKLPAGGSTLTALGTGLSAPQGVAVDGVGNLYIADTGNNRIVEIVAGGSALTVLPITGLLQPTRVALDTANNLFIADTGNSRVVEFSSSVGQTVVNFGSTITSLTPVGLALDPAGNLYVADSAGLQVLELLAGTASVNILQSSLLAPADLTVGPNASVYVADAQAPSVIYLNRAVGILNLGITNIGETSTETFSLANTGNAALTFPGPQISSPVGPAGSFSIAADATNGCAIGTPVSAGGNCLMDASFSPLTPSTPTQNYTFTSNAANNSAVVATLSGIGAHLTSTSMGIAISPSTATIGFGAPVTITATVTLSANVGAATGTITLFVDGKQQGAARPFGNGTVTLVLNPTVTTHTVTAKFSGDILYSGSSTTSTFTIVKASTVTTLAIATSAPNGTPTVTFTASLSSPTATGETGTISFYSGTTQIGQPVALTGTTAVLATSSIVFPANSFTAVYSGDGNFSSSTSAVNQPPADFTMAPSTTGLATAQGGVASGLITLTPIFNFAGTITPACTNLPTNAVCRFQPTTVTFSGNTPVGLFIQVFTGVDTTAVASLEKHDSSLLTLAMLSPFGLGALALFGFKRRKGTRLAQLLLVAIMALCAAGGLSGCLAPHPLLLTPTGSETITVTFTSSGTSTPQTHSVNYTLSVYTP